MRIIALLVPSLVVSLAACGGGGTDYPDARIITSPDAFRPCPASEQYGSPTPDMEAATRDADTLPETIYYEAALNADPKFDNLSLELWRDAGAFEGGEIEPKLIQLGGVESQYETCGACLFIYGNMDPDNDYAYEGTYLAVAGTLNISSISPNLTGMLLNTRLVEVTIDADSSISMPVGNCAAEISSLQFDFPVTTDVPMFTGAAKSRRHTRRR